MALDKYGAYIYGYAPEISILGVQERLTDKIRPTLDVATDTLSGLYYDSVHNVVYMPVQDTGGTENDTVLMFDWGRRNIVTAWWQLDLSVNTIFVHNDTVYLGASDEARVYRLDTTKFLSNSWATTKDFNLGSDFNKLVDFIKFTAKNVTG